MDKRRLYVWGITIVLGAIAIEAAIWRVTNGESAPLLLRGLIFGLIYAVVWGVFEWCSGKPSKQAQIIFGCLSFYLALPITIAGWWLFFVFLFEWIILVPAGAYVGLVRSRLIAS